MKSPNIKYDIFISFDRSNSEITELANDFHSTLTDKGYSVFSISKKTSREITDALQNSHSLLLLCNNPSVTSYEVLRNEFNTFYAQKKEQDKIFAFRTKGFKKKNRPDILKQKDIQWTDDDFDKQIKCIEKWKKPLIVVLPTMEQQLSSIRKKWTLKKTIWTVALGTIGSIIASIIIYFFTLLLSFFSCSNDTSSLEFTVKDTIIYINDTLNLQDLLTIVPDSVRKCVTFTRNGNTIGNTIRISQPADSGQYVASIKNHKGKIIRDSLFLHVQDPCEQRSVKIDPANKTIHNAPIKLLETIKVTPVNFDEQSKKTKWQTEKGKEVTVAEKTGKYVVTVTDDLCKEGKRDTISITIKPIADSLNLPARSSKVSYRTIITEQYYKKEIVVNKKKPNEIFSEYFSNDAKIGNKEEFNVLIDVLKKPNSGLPPATIENGYVMVFNNKGRIMGRFSKDNKDQAKINRIREYKQKGYDVQLFNIEINF